MRARAEGLPVVSVAALVQEPLTSIISLPEADISRPADLEGKRVGTAGIDYQSAYLDTVLERAGVDPARVDQQDVGFNLSGALLAGQVDAVLGAFWNYEDQLRLRGPEPRSSGSSRPGSHATTSWCWWRARTRWRRIPS